MGQQKSCLVVSPLSLQFEFIPNQPSASQISLHNPTKDRIAFKIESNQPYRYYIDTKTSYINPGETIEVYIHMDALSEAPKNINTDKFTIHYAPVSRGMFDRDLPGLLTGDFPYVEEVEVGVVLKQQETEKIVEAGETFQDTSIAVKNLPKPNEITEKPQSSNDNNATLEQESVETIVHQVDVQERGDSAECLIVNEKDLNDAKNVVKRRIRKQASIRERIKSSQEFVSDVLQKDLISGRVFLTFPLDLLFPRAIRTYSAQICQIILGIIIFFSLLVYFCLLFQKFSECQVSEVRTPEILNENCQPDYTDITDTRSLSVNGFWDGDQNYIVRNAGPWQFRFVGYQADEQTFLYNIGNLTENANNFITTLQNKTYIEILGEALFFSAKENGTNGTVEITANIDLDMVFDNYYYKQFSFINFKKQLLDSVNQGQSAKIGVGQPLPPLTYVLNCRGELTFNGSDYDCENVAKGTLETTNGQGDLTYYAPKVNYSNIFGEMFFQNITWYGEHAKEILKNPSFSIKDAFNRIVSMHDMLAYPEKPFTSKFNIQEAFIFDYCNNDGKEYCMGVFNESYGKDHFFYTWTPGFFNSLGSDIHELQGMGNRPGVAKYEAYINNLDMFGIFSGMNNIVLSPNGSNIDYIDYALIFVPQIIQHDVQDDKMVCKSCQDALHKDTDCQTNLYVILHQYAFPISNHSQFLFDDLTAQEIIEKFYVTSFIHGLESWVGYYRYRAGIHPDVTNNNNNNYNISKNPDSSPQHNYCYYYNKDFAQVDNLHCEGSTQWAFQNITFKNITVPFQLVTGIYTCPVQNCPGLLEKLARVWANVELLFLVVIFILSFVILLLSFIMSDRKKDKQEGAISLKDTLTALKDKVTEQV